MRRHRLQAVTLGHVRANQVVWHSPVHDDGTGYQLVNGPITRAEQAELARLEAAELVRKSDAAATGGYTMAMYREGFNLLASLSRQQKRAA